MSHFKAETASNSISAGAPGGGRKGERREGKRGEKKGKGKKEERRGGREKEGGRVDPQGFSEMTPLDSRRCCCSSGSKRAF